MDKNGLARLARLEGSPPGTAVWPVALNFPPPVAISSSGQITFYAPSDAGTFRLVQALKAQQFVEVMRRGQSVPGGTVTGTPILAGANGGGDLIIWVNLQETNGNIRKVLLRRTSAGLTMVAAIGQVVERGRGAGVTGILTGLGPATFGPDGTVVVQGAGKDFSNFFVGRPGHSLQPMLPGVNWAQNRTAYSVAIGASGIVAVSATSNPATESVLYLVTPATGDVRLVLAGRRDFRPAGPLTFGADDWLYFLAQNLDGLPDGDGYFPVGLYRYRQDATVPVPVAVPGEAVPGRRGLRLHGIAQGPIVSANSIAFMARFSGTDDRSIPTRGLFRIPLQSTLASGFLVATEGDEIPNANQVARFRDLSSTASGGLLFSGLLPGSGQLLASLPTTATTASVGRAQALQTSPIVPLVASGQPLAPPSRQLVDILGPIISLGSDRELFVARFSQAGSNGEGLFTVDRNNSIQAVVVTGEPASGLAGAQFVAFSSTQEYQLGPPAAAADGTVVFKAGLERSGTTTFGVFQWMGAAVSPVSYAEPHPDDLAVLPGDRPPYALEQWAAGVPQRAYLTVQPQGGKKRLFRRSPNNLSSVKSLDWLVIPDYTPIDGLPSARLSELRDYVVTNAGRVFVHGVTESGPGLFRVETDRLVQLVRRGDQIPGSAGCTKVEGFAFDGRFELLPESARGALLFRAWVEKRSEAPRRGLFRLDLQDKIETILVESLEVSGPRDLCFGTLAESPNRQTANGTTVYAIYVDDKDKRRWSIWRWRARTNTLVAQEGQPLPNGRKIVSLEAERGSGPVFALNDAGEVAFLATDGLQWGIYRFSDQLLPSRN